MESDILYKIILDSCKDKSWIEIDYLNRRGGYKHFYILVKDIDFVKNKIICDQFNPYSSNKDNDLKNRILSGAHIFINRILNARKSENFKDSKGDELIAKVEKDTSGTYSNLNYERYKNNVLNYLSKCYKTDTDDAITDMVMIEGIDLDSFNKDGKVVLNDDQLRKFFKFVKPDTDTKSMDETNLCLAALSVDRGNKHYVLFFRKVYYDVKAKELYLSDELNINSECTFEGSNESVFDYLDDPQKIELYNLATDNIVKAAEFLKTYIDESVGIINTRPDFYLAKRKFELYLDTIYLPIQNAYLDRSLPAPLAAFFGDLSYEKFKNNDANQAYISASKLNFEQARVLFNALINPITYVQGPPGTGKTSTILSVVFSQFLNDRTTLVCSSNNKPVDGIKEKLNLTYKGKTYSLPFLRLGNFEDTKKAVKFIGQIVETIDNNKFNLSPIELPKCDFKSEFDRKNHNISEFFDYYEKNLSFDAVKKLVDKYKLSDDRKFKVNNYLKEMSRIKPSKFDELSILDEVSNVKESDYLKVLLINKTRECLSLLKNKEYIPLKNIFEKEKIEERTKAFNKYLSKETNLELLLKVFPIILNTNISSHHLGNYITDFKSGKRAMFDLVIMDESAQCNIPTALIPISRAKRLLLVGDSNQLKPIVKLDKALNEAFMKEFNVKKVYDYTEKSIFDVMTRLDSNSPHILLKKLYRCCNNIIKYANQRFYNSQLEIMTKNDGHIEFVNVVGNNVATKNTSSDEALEVIKYIEEKNLDDVMIITPFRNQKILINKLLEEHNLQDRAKVGTIHSIQGDEKTNILMSFAITSRTGPHTYNWVKNNKELLNVGTTRAKNNLVIFGDEKQIMKFSNGGYDDLVYCLNFAKKNGDYTCPPENPEISIGFSNNSFNEDDFDKTMKQIDSTRKLVHYRNVPVSKVFSRDVNLRNSRQEFDCVVYKKYFFNIKKIICIFEIDGIEHFTDTKTMLRDRRKEEICKEKNIPLIHVRNVDVRNYAYIIEIIESISKEIY